MPTGGTVLFLETVLDVLAPKLLGQEDEHEHEASQDKSPV